jgi:hypothetical protein
MTTAPVGADSLPPYTFDQPCPQCRRHGPQMVIFDRGCREVTGQHYHRECRA